MEPDGSLANALFCSQCGRALGASEALSLGGVTVCGGCKPELVRRMQMGATPKGAMVYKGFWIRFVAKLLDGLIVFFLISPVWVWVVWRIVHAGLFNVQPGQPPNPRMIFQVAAIEAWAWLAWVVVDFTYNTVLLGKFEATAGKLAIGAKVRRADGGRISWGQAAGRSAMEYVSGMILDIGYIVAAFDRQKRALHDLVAGTVVVQK